MPDGLVEPAPDHRQFFLQLENALLELIALNCSIQRNINVFYRTHVFCLARIERRGTLRTVAINRDRFQSEPPAFYVRVHDVIDRSCFGHVNRFRNRTA